MNARLAIVFLGANLASGLRLKFDDNHDGSGSGDAPGKFALHCSKQPNEPTECGPQNRFSFDEMRATLGEFKDIWAKHPGGGKLSVNHQFAEWFLVKTLKPTAIIESGVLHGQATWAMRQAAGPDARIFSFDPVDQTSKGFRDSSPNTKYLTGSDWKDLGVIDWDALGLSKADRANAVVILDDHQIFFDRFETLRKLGFRHVFVEDNNMYGFGNTSPNFFCTKAELYKETYVDQTPEVIYKSALTKSATLENNPAMRRIVTWAEHAKNLETVHSNLKSYFEFPAVYDMCNKRPALLKKEELSQYGLPSGDSDYEHRYPPYFEIKQ